MKFFFRLVLVISWAMMSFSTAPKVVFESNDWASCQFQAIRGSKLFYTCFEASYCWACHEMDKTTYLNDELSLYMQQNAVAKKINVEDFDGVTLSKFYKIDKLPTILIFDRDGNLFRRLEGYQSAQKLLGVMEEAKGQEL